MTETVDPYRIVAPIARGSMAETFVDERTGLAGFAQRVCVKRIFTQGLGRPEVDQRLARSSRFRPRSRRALPYAHRVREHSREREARIAATLRHPNIVGLLDFGRDGEVWWMSLELVDGLDLRALMTAAKHRGERLPLEAILFIAAAELAKALAHEPEV